MNTDRQPLAGEIWRHTKTGGHYQIVGASYNVVTDTVDVVYSPLYPCDFQRFNRPLYNHSKAWTLPNTDGTDRFVRVAKHGARHDMAWYASPRRHAE